jgi:hypothetical protein
MSKSRYSFSLPNNARHAKDSNLHVASKTLANALRNEWIKIIYSLMMIPRLSVGKWSQDSAPRNEAIDTAEKLSNS